MVGLDKLAIGSKRSIWVGFCVSGFYSECARCESSTDMYKLAEISRDIPQALGQVTDCYLNIDVLTFSFHIIFK